MKTILLFAFALFFTCLNAQQNFFFTEGTNNDFYDQGIVNLAGLGNSTFEHTYPSCCPEYNDKVPCSTNAYNGNTSLKFHYTPASDGNWEVSVFTSNWGELDITNNSHLFFYVYSEDSILSNVLPLIALKAISTVSGQETNTSYYNISDYNTDIPAGKWTKISFPLDTIMADDNNVNLNFAKCKAVVFAQSESNGIERTLLIDDIYTWVKPESLEPVENLSISAYDSHTGLSWNIPIVGLECRLYASVDSGTTYNLITETTQNQYLHFINREDTALDISYRMVTVLDDEESDPVDTTVTIREFTDDELMDMVQKYTWRYFWDYADPSYGMIYERNENDQGGEVASGASGMGLMALIVGYEREYANKEDIKDRIIKMLYFLENCDRFHGAYSHWYNGSTMKTTPFFTEDNGGDIVETSFVAEGLIAVRNYFTGDDEKDILIREKATMLWEEIEWDWYTQNGSNTLYWHWSPNYGWEINHAFGGFNETLITYFLAASSPTNPIPTKVYHSGWARNGNIVNERTYYGNDIKLAPDYGGPMFWVHYSFMGLNPFEYTDQYANYGEEATSIAKIHYEYAKANPFGYENYGENCWGQTASYDPEVGYREHRPYSGDNGTISPTAALGSFPYTPTKSMAALKYFYRERGEDLFGKYGFYDAFNDELDTVIEKYLGIDQGPIIVMMENYRSGLIWNAFMEDVDVKEGIDKIVSWTNIESDIAENGYIIYPNPTNTGQLFIHKESGLNSELNLKITSIDGKTVSNYQVYDLNNSLITIDIQNIRSGCYLLHLKEGQSINIFKVIIQ
ncbi:MAG: T9SS type A sorting domain-containing protein [Salinivirgaceae bacterium]|jgi:hypothetical protein|nr:T9SS type A sorting domain-containing protein [Salinivirgaceae bacterium]